MTRDDIIRMAQEAGITYQLVVSGWGQHWIDIPVHFERFAALVAAAAVRETSAEYRLGWNDGAMMEREECAKVCEELNAWNEDDPGSSAAAAIRARGQE